MADIFAVFESACQILAIVGTRNYTVVWLYFCHARGTPPSQGAMSVSQRGQRAGIVTALLPDLLSCRNVTAVGCVKPSGIDL